MVILVYYNKNYNTQNYMIILLISYLTTTLLGCFKNLTLILFIGWCILFWYNLVSVFFVENCSTPFYNKNRNIRTKLTIYLLLFIFILIIINKK